MHPPPADSLERYRRLLLVMPHAWAAHRMIFDDEGRPVDYTWLETNAAFETHSGLAREMVIGRRASEVIPGIQTMHPELIAAFGRVALTQRSDIFDLYFEPFERHYHMLVISTEHGRFDVFFEDITPKREMARRLRESLTELKRSNTALDEFAYVASHDLKSPLRDVLNLSSWLAEDLGDTLPEDSSRHLRTLRERVRRMECMLDDLLDYSRSGRLLEPPGRVDIDELLRDVGALVGRPVGFQIELPHTAFVVESRRQPLHQVLRNLIDNAIKHHDRDDGQVRVEVERRSHELLFTVRDDGPGIPAHAQSRIFGMFQTMSADEGRGSGIGLALVKKLVESQGGQIGVESEPGHGSAFQFSWPCTAGGPKGAIP